MFWRGEGADSVVFIGDTGGLKVRKNFFSQKQNIVNRELHGMTGGVWRLCGYSLFLGQCYVKLRPPWMRLNGGECECVTPVQ